MGIRAEETTGSDGTATIAGLAVNRTYEVTEIQAPKGYNRDTTVHKVKLTQANAKQTVTVTVNNVAQQGAIKIVKQDRDTKVKLAGAVFQWKDTSNGYTSRKTTGSDGTATIAGLSVNRTYEVTEIQAPKGYNRDTTVHKVKLTQANAKQTVTVTVNNVAQQGAIKIVKQDRDTKAKLAGAVFQWKDTSNGYTSRKTTGSDGTATIAGLAVNRTYEVTEIQAPKGYNRDTTVHKVKLTQANAKQTVTVTINNVIQKGTIKIVKQDRDTKAKLAGAVFQWKDASNGYTSRKTTGSDGTTTIAGLAVNRTYEVTEIQAPKGYIRDTAVHKVKLTPANANQTVTVTITNKRKTNTNGLLIKKVDNKYKNVGLSGAEFTLYRLDGKVAARGVTNAKGELRFTNLEENWEYNLVETKAPNGYFKNTNKTRISFKNRKNFVWTYTICNTRQISIDFHKYGEVPGGAPVPLKGAVFDLYDSSGKKIATNLVSGKDGLVRWPNVREGIYRLTETRAPKGYLRCHFWFNIQRTGLNTAEYKIFRRDIIGI
ncbi:SpaA isopeptide-forming pilin-related protein [Listeria aquatica]|uniref:SpaA isopeptide-forming pilin-related protein n=1 Tax=Listeria aquatica TaxID=1494960 RepID=UPI0031F4FA77